MSVLLGFGSTAFAFMALAFAAGSFYNTVEGKRTAFFGARLTGFHMLVVAGICAAASIALCNVTT